MSWLHGRAPPGCPQSVRSLKALRCLLPLPRRWPLTFRQDIPGPLPDIGRTKETCKAVTVLLHPLDWNSMRRRAGVASRNVKGARRGSGGRPAKRFKAPDRLRAARRAAAVERGNPRPPPRMEQKPLVNTEDHNCLTRHYVLNHQLHRPLPPVFIDVEPIGDFDLLNRLVRPDLRGRR